MPNKEFLEKQPLYRKFEISCENDAYHDEFLFSLPKPAINIFCRTCNSNQTFNMVNDYWELEDDGRNAKALGTIVRAHYKCSSCNKVG